LVAGQGPCGTCQKARAGSSVRSTQQSLGPSGGETDGLGRRSPPVPP
jgi:hypothetical protein